MKLRDFQTNRLTNYFLTLYLKTGSPPVFFCEKSDNHVKCLASFNSLELLCQRVISSMMSSKIDFLYTNIGRGHPFYLDGIMQALVRSGNISIVRQKHDVFELSSGLSLNGWQLARWLYQKGSSGGLVGSIYKFE